MASRAQFTFLTQIIFLIMSVNSLFDVASLQAYSGTDDVAFVADPLQGGTFYYQAGWRSYKNSFSFSSTALIDSSGGIQQQGFAIGQQITISGTGGVNDGVFTITNVTSTNIVVSGGFTAQSAVSATIVINYTPYTQSLDLSGTTITDATGGFLAHGFLPGQKFVLSGSTSDGVYVIQDVTATTITLPVAGLAAQTGVSCTISLQDDGTVFNAIGKGVGYWERDLDPKDGLNVTWFGAKGNAFYKASNGNWYSTHDHKILSNDDTASIQRAMDVAHGNTLAMAKVVIPPGMFLHSTLYVPTGVLLTGAGAIAESLSTATSKLVMKADGGDSIRIRETGVVHTTSDRLFWFGGITNLEFFGESTNTTGWAISCRNADGEAIAPQDMNFFENLQMRNYPQGGIEFPDCAVPLNVRNIKGSLMNGPVIFFGATTPGRVGQSMNFDNISCDHSVGGGIWLDSLDYKTNIIITNLKSEAGLNNAFPGQPSAQLNAIICNNCDNTPIFIGAANHQNTSIDLGTLKGNPTLSIANPCVVTLNSHGLSVNDPVKFITSGLLPTSVVASQTYYVVSATTNTFTFAATVGGTAISTLGQTQSGTHSLYAGFDPVAFMKPGDLLSAETLLGNPTISIADPAVITLTNTLVAGDTVKFYSKGALPSNIIAGQVYYVLASGLSSSSFQISVTPGGSPVYIAGSQSGVHSLYQQITTGKVPRVTWTASTLRVRKPTHSPDVGIDPFIIAKTGIPYTTTEGGFNVTRELYKDTASIGNGSTVNYTSGGTVNFANGSVASVESGSALNFESGSEANLETGSVLNVQNGGVVDFESGSTALFDAGANGLVLYNTADQVTNYDRASIGYINNMLQLATQAGGTRAARAIKLSSTTATNSTAALTLNRASGPLFLFELEGTGGTSFTPLVRFRGGVAGSTGMQLFSEIVPTVLQTGAGGYTALNVNVTENTTGSGDKRLIAAQIGGNDKFVVDNGGTVTATGDVKLSTAGKGIYIKEGSNATMGTSTLSGGTLTINTSKVTANSRIFLTAQEGTVTDLGMLYIQSRTAGTSFTVKSTNALDTCTFSWLIVEPA